MKTVWKSRKVYSNHYHFWPKLLESHENFWKVIGHMWKSKMGVRRHRRCLRSAPTDCHIQFSRDSTFILLTFLCILIPLYYIAVAPYSLSCSCRGNSCAQSRQPRKITFYNFYSLKMCWRRWMRWSNCQERKGTHLWNTAVQTPPDRIRDDVFSGRELLGPTKWSVYPVSTISTPVCYW